LRAPSSEGFFEKVTDNWIEKKEPYVLTLNYDVISIQNLQNVF